MNKFNLQFFYICTDYFPTPPNKKKKKNPLHQIKTKSFRERRAASSVCTLYSSSQSTLIIINGSLLRCTENNPSNAINTTPLKQTNIPPQHFSSILLHHRPSSPRSAAIGCRYAHAACCNKGSLIGISLQLPVGEIDDGSAAGMRSFKLV